MSILLPSPVHPLVVLNRNHWGLRRCERENERPLKHQAALKMGERHWGVMEEDRAKPRTMEDKTEGKRFIHSEGQEEERS